MGQEKQEESPLKGKPVVVHGLGTSSRSQPIHTLTKASFELYTICGRGPKQISNAETITRDGAFRWDKCLQNGTEESGDSLFLATSA